MAGVFKAGRGGYYPVQPTTDTVVIDNSIKVKPVAPQAPLQETVAAWIADTAAYFVGRAFGKHKLCPLISPHKTVEGAIGGVFFAVLFFVLFCFGYSKLRSGVHISYLAATIDGAVCAVMGIVGDLMASVVKRQRGIKDFGHIMPGHGGVMDRFDSFLFVAPTLYLILQVLPIVTTLA